MSNSITYGTLVRAESKSINLSWSCMLLTFSFCVFFILAFKVANELKCTDIAYKIANEKKQQMALEMDRQELNLQISVSKRLDVLENIASQRGLVQLNPSQIAIIK